MPDRFTSEVVSFTSEPRKTTSHFVLPLPIARLSRGVHTLLLMFRPRARIPTRITLQEFLFFAFTAFTHSGKSLYTKRKSR